MSQGMVMFRLVLCSYKLAGNRCVLFKCDDCSGLSSSSSTPFACLDWTSRMLAVPIGQALPQLAVWVTICAGAADFCLDTVLVCLQPHQGLMVPAML